MTAWKLMSETKAVEDEWMPLFPGGVATNQTPDVPSGEGGDGGRNDWYWALHRSGEWLSDWSLIPTDLGAKLESLNSLTFCQRRFDGSRAPSAKNHSRTYNEVPDGAFFLFVSKGFSEAIRLSETGLWSKIGLLTPSVSFHPPFTQIETH